MVLVSYETASVISLRLAAIVTEADIVPPTLVCGILLMSDVYDDHSLVSHAVAPIPVRCVNPKMKPSPIRVNCTENATGPLAGLTCESNMKSYDSVSVFEEAISPIVAISLSVVDTPYGVLLKIEVEEIQDELSHPVKPERVMPLYIPTLPKPEPKTVSASLPAGRKFNDTSVRIADEMETRSMLNIPLTE